MIHAFLAGLAYGFGLLIPVGVFAVLILWLVTRTALRVGAAVALGVVLADGLFAAVLAVSEGLGYLVVAIPVGVCAVLALPVARNASRVETAAAFNVALTNGLYVTVAILGSAALAWVLAPAAGPLRVVAAVVLLALATHAAARRSARSGAVASPDAEATSTAGAPEVVGQSVAGRGDLAPPPRRVFVWIPMLMLTLLNPMSMFYLAVLVLGLDPAVPVLPAAAVLLLGVFLASASCQLVVARVGMLAGRILAGPRGRLVISSTIGALVVVTLVAA